MVVARCALISGRVFCGFSLPVACVCDGLVFCRNFNHRFLVLSCLSRADLRAVPRESLIKLLVKYREATTERAYGAKALTSVGERGWRDSRRTHTRPNRF